MARQVALGLLGSWSGDQLDAVGGRAVLEAAAGSYPSVSGQTARPSVLLAELLWSRPRLVPTADVLRVYLVAGERVRRAFLHLLALRRDAEGVEALQFLLGPSGPVALVPSPTTPILEPLLGMDRPQRMVPTLLGLLHRSSWTWHAAGMLGRLQQMRCLDEDTMTEVVGEVTLAVHQIVDLCDRAASVAPAAGDSVRSDRERLGALAALLDELREIDQLDPLHRMLASADPRVAALGACRLVQIGEQVAPERLALIARDPVARADLYDGLVPFGHLDTMPPGLGPVDLNEARLTRWLADPTELGRSPDEMEYLTTCSPAEGDDVDLFRFRMNSPHWSSARGWMIGASGAFTYSCYVAEDECSIADHVEAIAAALAQWPDRRADGAA